MDTKIKPITAKPRTLSAKWTIEAEEDCVNEYGFGIDSHESKNCNSITEAIFRELYRRYRVWRRPPSIEDQIATSLAEEIRKEIDDQIIKDLTKAMQVPKDML